MRAGNLRLFAVFVEDVSEFWKYAVNGIIRLRAESRRRVGIRGYLVGDVGVNDYSPLLQ